MALTRKSVRAILQKDGELDDKLEQIMALYGASFNDYVPKSEVEQIKKEAAEEAIKNVPKTFRDSQEYKDMLAKVQAYEKKDDIRTLTDKGVKNEKYAEMLLDKIDKEKDWDEQMAALKEEYADMFNVEHEEQVEEPTKPQFGAATKGAMPSGKDSSSFGKYWGFVPQKD